MNNNKNVLEILNFFQFICFVLILAFVPIRFDYAYALSFELPKITAFLILTSVLFSITLLIILMRGNSYFIDEIFRLGRSKKIIYVILFLIITLILFSLSFLTSGNIITSFWGNYDKRMGLYLIIHLVIFCFCTVEIVIANKENIKNLLAVILPVPIIINLYVGILQIFEVNFDMSISQNRVVGTFGQANYLAGFCVMILPFLVYFLIFTKNKLAKLYQAFGIVGVLILIYYSTSRMSMMLLFGLIVLFIIILVRELVTIRKIALFINLMIIFWAVILGIVFMNTSKRFKESGIIDTTRKQIWQASIDAIKEKPILGYGLDNAGYVLPSYMYKNGIDVPIALDRAHNEFLDIMLNTGVPFFVFLAIFLIWGHIKLFSRFLKSANKQEAYFIFCVLISSVLFWIRGMVNVNGLFQYIWAFFLLALFIYLNLGKSADVRVDNSSGLHLDFNKITKKFLVSILALVIILNIYINLRFAQANKEYAKGNFQKAQLLNPTQIRYRIEHLQDAMIHKKLEPIEFYISKSFLSQRLYDGVYYYRIGKYYKQIGDFENALLYLQKALEVEPVKDIYTEEIESIEK